MEKLQVEKIFTTSETYNGQICHKDITVASQYPKDRPVYIHYSDKNGWNDVSMNLELAKDGFSIWGFHDNNGNAGGNSSKGTLPAATDISFYQDTDTGRIWDNNAWQNYHLNECDGPLLGYEVTISLFKSYLSNGLFTGSIAVKNLGYQKNVTVVYKTDKNQTEQTCKAFFSNYYTVGPHDMVQSPNVNNCELFTFSTNVCDAKTINFYLTYEINGQLHVDNNWGRNYTVSA